MTIAAYNLERFFNDVDDPGVGDPVLTTTAFNNRLNKASIAVRNFLRFPDILGVVEVENLSTLQTLAAKINSDAVANSQPNPNYVAYLVEGNDIGGIDAGFLVKTSVVFGSTPRVTVNAVVQEGAATLFTNPDSTTSLLNDRPPLRLDATVNFPNGTTFPVTVIVNHLRSLSDVDSTSAGSNGWPTDGARVRAKRRAQAEFLAGLVQTRQAANSNERVALVGDFNAFEFNDGYVDSMGTIQGAPTAAAQVVLASSDLVSPDLTNLFNTAPATQRYSFTFDGSAQSLDHVLVNQALIAGTLARRIEHPRIDADFPETARNDANTAVRLSDHDPIVGYFQLLPCTITCPANITTTAATGQCGAMVNYSAPATSGDCGSPVTCTPPSNSFFVVGTTTVTCTTPSENSCTFTVRVNDNQNPTIACPGNITANENPVGSGGAQVSFTTPTPADNCSGARAVCAPASGSTFPLGTTTVTCTATDASGNTAQCSFTVAVQSCVAVNCPPVGPGALPQPTSPVSDQRAGSVLIYNIYTSATDSNRQNTRISITNVEPTRAAFVHMFFVDGATCGVADSFICLTANQTASFLASDLDPGTTGYIVAIAVDRTGCPVDFNFLIGDEYVKFASGHAANLGAEAVTAIAGGLPVCNENSTTAELAFDGMSYSVLPHVLALDNIGSRADGNDTLLILNRIGGNLATGAATLTSIFGLLFDDAENALSFSFAPGTCQFRGSLSSGFPRTAPRFENVIPAGRSGWMKLWVAGGTAAMTGAAINFNANAAASAGAFNQGHNLHVLTNTNAMVYTIPIFPPSC